MFLRIQLCIAFIVAAKVKDIVKCQLSACYFI